jgi:hypothetical protein
MYRQLDGTSRGVARRVAAKVLRFPSRLEGEPFDCERAKALLRDVLKTGKLSISGHAQSEMRKDDLQSTDVQNVLRAGWVEPAELHKGTWRYRFKTNRICVVVVFRSETHAVVVTVWRLT